jgi:ribulose 1,5-bisphosphate carboxylase large subunit-like protein
MFTDALYLSGSDILYPGGAPSLGGAYRELDHVAKDALSLGVSRYQKIVQKREPMPTIAGGVHPGELQALYELLGPDVGYFLGGAVALHSGGPKQGAELCVAIINASIKLRNEAKENEFSKALDDKLIRKIQDSYPLPPAATNETLAYLSPQIFAGKSLRPWSSH